MRKSLLLCSAMFAASAAYGQTYFSDNFDDQNISDWTLYDADGDTNNWETVALTGLTPAIASYSYDNVEFEALTPDNYIVTPAINLSTATSATLTFKVKAQDPDWAVEKYAVYAATTNSVSAFLATTPLLTETADVSGPGGIFYAKTVDLSAFAGQSQVYIAFRHYESTDMFAIHIDDVVVAATPTAAPNCPTLVAPANAAMNVDYQAPLTLSWTAPTSGTTVTTYDVYMGTSATPTTLIGTSAGLSFSTTGLLPSTTYYWMVVPKNAAGSATGCTVYSFTTGAPSYCSAGATSTSFEKISNVTFAGIDNTSTSTAGYEDFTAVPGAVTAGSTYPFSATFSGTSYTSDQVMVWIDFNNDKDFTDAGEQVLMTPTKVSPWTGNITIPEEVAVGTVRMRVRLHDSSLNGNLTPCGTSGYGQVEDYTLNISTLDVNDAVKNAVKVYPNPVVDVLNIESASKVKSVSVFDATGRSVSNYKLDAAKSQVNMSGVASGVYMVTIQMENETKTVKVIKK